MRAEILAIGSELTCGSRLDTNSQWLSRELEALGWTVVRHTTLADELDAIVAEISAAPQRSDLLLITGGLGPTLDDLTRDALAQAFASPLERDPVSLQQIRDLFAARGRSMPESNLRQADRPRESESLFNSCGTAPGILMRIPRTDHAHPCLIAALPGVPAEMRVMFQEQVLPQLPASSARLVRGVLRSFGFGESEAEQRLGDLTARGRNPEVGITASEAVISLWVSSRSADAETAEQMFQRTAAEIRDRLGAAVYGDGDIELHEVLLQQLHDRRLQISVLEGTTTGGQIGMWFSADHRSSTVLEQAALLTDSDWNKADSTADNDPFADWKKQVVSSCDRIFSARSLGGILLSSGCCDQQQESGVMLRRGQIAVATPDLIRFVDVSMSGNLRIFRQRAARTAINLLRLHYSAPEWEVPGMVKLPR